MKSFISAIWGRIQTVTATYNRLPFMVRVIIGFGIRQCRTIAIDFLLAHIGMPPVATITAMVLKEVMSRLE